MLKVKGERVQSDYEQMMRLACPVFMEIMLRALLGNVDQLMLSNYSATAVAAVGNANQIMNVMILVLNVVCVASTILIAQYIGAGKRKELDYIYTMAVAINVMFSILLSSLIFVKEPVFTMMRVPEELMAETKIYFTVVASSFLLQGIFMSFSAIFRSNSMMEEIMAISVLSNIMNVCGNLILINGTGFIPPLGVLGAAISTVASLFLSVCAVIYLYWKKIRVPLRWAYIRKPDIQRIGQLFRLGIPAAGDSISYNTMQLVMMSFINSYGADSASAKAYTGMIVIFVYMCSSAIAQANQIKVGYLTGAGKAEQAKVLVTKSVKTSVAVSVCLAILLYVFYESIFRIFTQDEAILGLIQKVLLIDIFLEIGRAVNMVMINSLLAAGDTKYPVSCAIFSMWLIAVPSAYLFGTVMELGIAGVWVGLAMDEWCRAMAFLRRWRSNVWQKKCLVL